MNVLNVFSTTNDHWEPPNFDFKTLILLLLLPWLSRIANLCRFDFTWNFLWNRPHNPGVNFINAKHRYWKYQILAFNCQFPRTLFIKHFWHLKCQNWCLKHQKRHLSFMKWTPGWETLFREVECLLNVIMFVLKLFNHLRTLFHKHCRKSVAKI